MTPAAHKFMGSLTLEALSGKPLYLDQLSLGGSGIAHTDLSSEIDLLLVAPATADIIAKIAHGFGDDPVSATALALKAGATLAIAPAMNPRMWSNAAVSHNIALLKERGAIIIGPAHGDTACGDLGVGRMSEPDEIVAMTLRILAANHHPKKIMILSGPTREYLDDVRFISNGSSGKMGAALAEAAYTAGHDVTVISGPSEVKPPRWIRTIAVESADEMLRAARPVPGEFIFSPAAIADYAPQERRSGKPAKDRSAALSLSATPDILATLSKERSATIVAFAAENDDTDIPAAVEKAKRKGARFIVLNRATATMGKDEITAQFIDAHTGVAAPLGPLAKAEAAHEILIRALEGKVQGDI